MLCFGCSSAPLGSGSGGAGGSTTTGIITTGGAGGDGEAGAGGKAASTGSAGASTIGGMGGQADAADCSGFIPPLDHPSATVYTLTADTVTDTATGLMWQRKLGSSDPINLPGGCSIGLAGFTDWRLPTVYELATIIDFGVHDPTIDATTFPDTPSGYYGTSTKLYMHSGSVWTVDFATGATLNGTPPFGYVRCVRRDSPKLCISGARLQKDDKASAAYGVATVVDRLTQLGWQQATGPDPVSWVKAKEYCSSFGGAAHLPTAKELLSLVDWGAAAAINLDLFPDTARGSYWTATEVPGSAGSAFAVGFGDAVYTGTLATPEPEAHLVRCVVNR
jgi:hypothetical protein